LDLATALAAIEGRPWAEFGKQGKPITSNAIARQLKPFPIKPGTIRFGDKTDKGYKLKAFEDDFIRYLPDPPSPTVTPSQSSSHAGFSGFPTVTPENDVTVANPLKAAAHLGCYGVTVENSPGAEDEENSTQNPPEDVAESDQFPDDLEEGVV
jgi:hypothetical protein